MGRAKVRSNPEPLARSISLEGKSLGNPWMDLGRVVLRNRIFADPIARQASNDVVEEDKVKDRILSYLYAETGNLGQYLDESTGEMKSYAKKSWLYPANKFIKVTPKSKKDEVGRLTAPPKAEVEFEGAQRGKCDICGREDQPLDSLKMWMYPFLVVPSKFGNFYSGAKRGVMVCPTCAWSGLAAYLGVMWARYRSEAAGGSSRLDLVVFYSPDFARMEGLYKRLWSSGLVSFEPQNWGKMQRLPFLGKGPYETAMSLLLFLFDRVREEEKMGDKEADYLGSLLGLVEAQAEVAPVSLTVVSGSDEGKSFKTSNLVEVSKLFELYGLYKRWLEELEEEGLGPREALVSFFSQFSSAGEIGAPFGDRICRCVIQGEDLVPHVEGFLFSSSKAEAKRPLKRGSLCVIKVYVREVLGMDERFYEEIASFGRRLGVSVFENESLGLLYNLRNAKNVEDFLKVLNEAQFKLGVSVPSDLLAFEKGDRVKSIPWARVKALISIHAMNAYLSKSRAKETLERQESSGEEEVR